MLERGGTALYHAPAMIVLLMDEGSWAALDCGIVCQTVSLAATSLGVENCICGFARLAFTGEKGAYFREKLAFPEGFGFGVSVLLGYSDKTGKPHEPDMAKLSYIG